MHKITKQKYNAKQSAVQCSSVNQGSNIRLYKQITKFIVAPITTAEATKFQKNVVAVNTKKATKIAYIQTLSSQNTNKTFSSLGLVIKIFFASLTFLRVVL